MSRLRQSDGLSILARYASVAANAVASSASPLKSAANEQAREDQVKVGASEDGQTDTATLVINRHLPEGMASPSAETL